MIKRDARMQIHQHNHDQLTTQEERRTNYQAIAKDSRRYSLLHKAPREEKNVTKQTCVNEKR